MTSPKWLRRRLATSMINAICQNFGKLCSAVFFNLIIYLLFWETDVAFRPWFVRNC